MEKLFAFNIVWDLDDEDVLAGVELPCVVEIPADLAELFRETNDDEAISDWLTEKTGFCHKGFELSDVYDSLTEDDVCAVVREAAHLGVLPMVGNAIIYKDESLDVYREATVSEYARLIKNDYELLRLIQETNKKKMELNNKKFFDGDLTVITDGPGAKLSVEKFVADCEDYIPLSRFVVRGAIVTVIHEFSKLFVIYRYGKHGDYWEEIGILQD